MTLEYIVWKVKPQILDLGKFEIRWYGLLFAAAFVLGYLIMQRVFKREGLKTELLDKLTIYMALGTIVGARLGHCLFYEPAYYLKHPLDILKIYEGGLASHGAALGILIALCFFVRKYQKKYIWILDRIAIVVALSGFFIRMGNLMNSEIYGDHTTKPWGFIFVLNDESLPKHPTQLYEGLAYLFLFSLLYKIYFWSEGKVRPGLLFSIFLVFLFTARFLIEFIKEEQVAFEQTMSLNMGQILSIPFILFGVGLFIYTFRKKSGVELTQEKE